MSAGAGSAKAAGDTVAEVGRVFGNGGTDGLILYAMILATILMFLALVVSLILHAKERATSAATLAAQSKDFASAARETAESSKDVGTALASSASASLAFEQSCVRKLERVEVLLLAAELRLGIKSGD